MSLKKTSANTLKSPSSCSEEGFFLKDFPGCPTPAYITRRDESHSCPDAPACDHYGWEAPRWKPLNFHRTSPGQPLDSAPSLFQRTGRLKISRRDAALVVLTCVSMKTGDDRLSEAAVRRRLGLLDVEAPPSVGRRCSGPPGTAGL
ncbi:hypothetical protein EYF80_043826 [Liparis tanakae]|uniref:Uncharacterized protein n=1 Tax=Liparis tanakae TaxID=230148 RepID=A0A4Z2FYL3_9TELE|nr:hypothetical protein EYF80_043826 [Liparis tanakae]